MPKENFPPDEQKEAELTQAELEKLLKVKMDTSIIYNKNWAMVLSEGINLRFIVTQDFNIHLVVGGVHNDIFNKLYREKDQNFDREKSLWPDGICHYKNTNPDDPKEGELIRFRSTGVVSNKIPHLQEAVKNKIKAFLNENGFKIK